MVKMKELRELWRKKLRYPQRERDEIKKLWAMKLRGYREPY